MQCHVMRCNDATRCNAMERDAMRCNVVRCDKMQYDARRWCDATSSHLFHLTSPHFTSLLHLTSLDLTSSHLTSSFHFTSPHLTSFHFFISLHLTSLLHLTLHYLISSSQLTSLHFFISLYLIVPWQCKFGKRPQSPNAGSYDHSWRRRCDCSDFCGHT